MTQEQRRRRGRPPVERRRVPMALRITPELSDQLVARAQETGRSITQEMELLLEQALLTEKLMGGKIWRVAFEILIKLNDAVITANLSREEPTSLDEPVVYWLGMITAIETLAKHFPKETPPDCTREEYILLAIDTARSFVQERFSKKDTAE